jgi:hypothetical protein
MIQVRCWYNSDYVLVQFRVGADIIETTRWYTSGEAMVEFIYYLIDAGMICDRVLE